MKESGKKTEQKYFTLVVVEDFDLLNDPVNKKAIRISNMINTAIKKKKKQERKQLKLSHDNMHKLYNYKNIVVDL